MPDLLTPFAIILAGALIAWQIRTHVALSLVGLQLFLVIVGALGFYKIEANLNKTDSIAKGNRENQERLTKERLVRSKVQAEINRYVCNENNKQDRILAGLIEVSIGGQSSFGHGVDLSSLTDFDKQVIASIGRVQKLTEADPAQFKEVFERALRQLQATTPCGTVVRAFLAASTTDDLKAIRQILKDASDESLKHLKPPARK